jgi:hypothetical protein
MIVKSRFSLVSILAFGALSALLILAMILGSGLMPGASPSAAPAAYPPPATLAAKPTGQPGIAKSPEPTKQRLAPTVTITPSPTPVVLENGWYLYTNSEAGYSISYPPNAWLRVNHEPRDKYPQVSFDFIIADCKCGYMGMVIMTEDNSVQSPIESIIEKWHKEGDRSDVSVEMIRQAWSPFKIGAVTAYKTTFRPFFYEFSIFVPYKDRVALILPVPDNRSGMGMDPKALALFDQIMATFTVLP